MAGTATSSAVVHRPHGIKRVNIALTTDASGDVTATSVVAGFGRLVAILHDGGLDASATITIKDAKTGATLVTVTTGTEDVPYYGRPTKDVVDVAGAAITGHANNPNTDRDIYVAGSVTVTVASGGNEETAILSLIVDETDFVPNLQ